MIGVDEYTKRYQTLNEAQAKAVDTIDGPLLVLAGPGTGKTELLSMRVANILHQTDTLPSSILCLTYTESGAAAMRDRLTGIIGPEAYKVAVHTFHSFGSEIISQNNQYFFRGANFQPADEITQYEILRKILEELDYTNPLAGKFGDEFTHLRDIRTTISELKQSGLTSDELLKVIDANTAVLDSIEHELTDIFAGRISKSMLDQLIPLASRVASLSPSVLPTGVTQLSSVLALSMAHAFDAAVETGKTTPLTAWRNAWMEKNSRDEYVFRDRQRHHKLHALSHIYYLYLARMDEAGLYDYDDMILQVIHAMETNPDLKLNLQEKFQYMLVDEFQDTNLAQLRILLDLTDNAVHEGRPNIMAVGDDDQAIYSFQGADVGNIQRFREQYRETGLIVLTDNYRSTQKIIDHARDVITQGQDRLENAIDGLIKDLLAKQKPAAHSVGLIELESTADERQWLASDIKRAIDSGEVPQTIAVLARRHNELVALLPYLADAGVSVNYERHDDVLENQAVRALELLAEITVALHHKLHDDVDSLLPELLAHPAFRFDAESVWRLSLQAYKNHLTWLEVMAETPDFKPLQTWLVEMSARVPILPLENFLDELVGVPDQSTDGVQPYVSPLYAYYFSSDNLAKNPAVYLEYLEALRTIRSKLREYHPDDEPRVTDFLDFITLHRQMGTRLTSVHRAAERLTGAINLMTAHGAKGLEFDRVYITGAVDNAWGERVRSRARLIGYPENLQLTQAGNNYDERLRLFFVAMTRARKHLTISYSKCNDKSRETMLASFLSDSRLPRQAVKADSRTSKLIHMAEIAWHDQLLELPPATMRQLLAPVLENYKLSVTHLNNFLDVTRGGPTSFLLGNLLRFPQAKSPSAHYGTAVHSTLQRAHNHFVSTGQRRPIEDVISDFQHELASQHLPAEDLQKLTTRGISALTQFLDSHYQTFTRHQKTELSFANQGAVTESAQLTGNLDLVDIDDGHILVTDYKTGASSRDWKGKTDGEKIRLHKYRQQLMFYQLLVTGSRDYGRYEYEGGVLQFVEPDRSGDIHALRAEATPEELEVFSHLIGAVWRSITTLELPDISNFEPNYKGMLAFEDFMIDKYRT